MHAIAGSVILLADILLLGSFTASVLKPNLFIHF